MIMMIEGEGAAGLYWEKELAEAGEEALARLARFGHKSAD